MAYSLRRLSKFNQLYAGLAIQRQENAIPVRYFAKEAPRPVLKGDQMLKDIFLDIKNKFETAISVFRKEKITIDPDDPAAVSRYAQVMKLVREKASLLSTSQRIQHIIQTQTKDIPDARSYLETLKEIRIKQGVPDNLGMETEMFHALDKVEAELKKPLLRSDKKGMALMHAEFDKINKKLGIRKEDLPKYEEELELEVAKAELQDLKQNATEAMETQLKREEFKDEKLVDPKHVDIRNFL